MRQMFSSWRPWAWRSRRAACAASGKQTCSGQTAWVRMEPFTSWTFSYLKSRCLAGAGCQRGKIRLVGWEQCLDVLAKWELVILHAQQVVPSAIQHDSAGRFGLGVQGIQRDETALQVQVGKELLCHRDFVGLGVDHRAGQVVLAGHADGGKHALTAAMSGLLAIQRDQLLFGRWAAQPLLNF